MRLVASLLLASLALGACDALSPFGGGASVCAANAGDERVDYFPLEPGSLGRFERSSIANTFGNPPFSRRDTVELVLDAVSCEDDVRIAAGRVVTSSGTNAPIEIRETEAGLFTPWTTTEDSDEAFARYYPPSAADTVTVTGLGQCGWAGSAYASVMLSRARGLERVSNRCFSSPRNSRSFSMRRLDG